MKRKISLILAAIVILQLIAVYLIGDAISHNLPVIEPGLHKLADWWTKP